MDGLFRGTTTSCFCGVFFFEFKDLAFELIDHTVDSRTPFWCTIMRNKGFTFMAVKDGFASDLACFLDKHEFAFLKILPESLKLLKLFRCVFAQWFREVVVAESDFDVHGQVTGLGVSRRLQDTVFRALAIVRKWVGGVKNAPEV